MGVSTRVLSASPARTLEAPAARAPSVVSGMTGSVARTGARRSSRVRAVPSKKESS